jgi:hypothetical protein
MSIPLLFTSWHKYNEQLARKCLEILISNRNLCVNSGPNAGVAMVLYINSPFRYLATRQPNGIGKFDHLS